MEEEENKRRDTEIDRETKRFTFEFKQIFKIFFCEAKNFFFQNSCELFIYFLLDFKRDMEKLVMKERERKHE